MNTAGNNLFNSSGFSLIEVLIAVVVLAIGLLGLAQMQVTGLINNHSAYQRSQATILMYDIADRMRSNMDGLDSYLTAYPGPQEALAVSAIDSLIGCKTTEGCTSLQMAKSDMHDWNAALAAILPKASGRITAVGNTYTVRVIWDDNRDGTLDINDPEFQVSFQP